MRLGLDDSKIGALVGSNPDKFGPYMGGLEMMGGEHQRGPGYWPVSRKIPDPAVIKMRRVISG